MATGVLIFDVESVPNAQAYGALLGISTEAMNPTDLEQAWGPDRPFKPGLQQVVAIACSWIDGQGRFSGLRSLGDAQDSERVLVESFFDIVRSRHPRLAGWNTGGFDLPVLITRALAHNIAAPDFYQAGQPYHGYLRRYDDEGHLDLMDQLSFFRASSPLKLDEAAAILQVPGKLDVAGNDVSRLVSEGQMDSVRHYCETDVLTTSLIFGRYARHRGWWDADHHQDFERSVEHFLEESPISEHQTFLSRWLQLRSLPSSS